LIYALLRAKYRDFFITNFSTFIFKVFI